MPSSSQSSAREPRLDFWRGLCLVDMLLVHLYYQGIQFGDTLGRWLGEYTRFAAGGFIFVCGLSIGVIFLPRARDGNKRSKTYRGLWRRSGYILAVHYLCAMVLIMMDICQGNRGNFLNPLTVLSNVFFLREGGDLLPFYVMMVALAPLLLQILRKRWGWLFLMIGSISAFIYGLWHPWTFAPAQHQNFPPILWQGIFICGLLLGFAWPHYNALAARWKMAMATVCWLGAGVMFFLEYSYQWGFHQYSFYPAFTKVPLSWAEAVRYLIIVFAMIPTTDLLWWLIGNSSFSAFVQTLGRKSLPVYVLHLWVVEGMGVLAYHFRWMGAWQLSYVLASLLILWLFALGLDVWKASSDKQLSVASAIQRLLRPAVPVAGALR